MIASIMRREEYMLGLDRIQMIDRARQVLFRNPPPRWFARPPDHLHVKTGLAKGAVCYREVETAPNRVYGRVGKALDHLNDGLDGGMTATGQDNQPLVLETSDDGLFFGPPHEEQAPCQWTG